LYVNYFIPTVGFIGVQNTDAFIFSKGFSNPILSRT
jgi:hypothetical protein